MFLKKTWMPGVLGTEPGTQSELRRGKGREGSVLGTGFSGIYKECHSVHPSVRGADQVSITFFILSGNRLRFLWTKSKRTHSCKTAAVA